ncbi:MAG: CPBP family intramembrane metalloprotease [Spirochaetales bacterium]|nr:CPBP family intramembrane metalloprotease [Spirochaetales bacterium]
MKVREETYETLLLYSVFFLPGYIQAGAGYDPQMFLSVFHNLMFLLTALPQFLLLYFLIRRKGLVFVFGFRRFTFTDLLRALAVFSLLWILVATTAVLVSATPLAEQTQNHPLNRGTSGLSVLVLLFFVSLVTGYLEEGFFRCYLYRQARRLGAGYLVSISAVSLLFGLGHMYQGIYGAVMTAFIGFLLQYLYTRVFRSIHPVAIGHGLYNFSIFFAAYFLA